MTKEARLYWGVGIVSLLLFAASFLQPGTPVSRTDLPWFIEHPAAGTTRVFGLTLGESTAADAEQRFREAAKPSLFKSPQGGLVAEVFFEQVTLAELKAKVVAGIAVPDTELRGMYERGLRLAGTGSGQKITLAPEDIARLRTLPIVSLTYMPAVRLSEETLLQRFGTPAERVRERKSGVVHWLYPQHGLDIALGGTEKPVMQYVSLAEFDMLRRPLLADGEVLQGG